MLEIEWKSSHYHSDGRKRSRPRASTVHGWLVKWRATFSGNERLRKEGMREMREAKAVRVWRREQKAARRVKASGSKILPFWPISFGNKKQQSQVPKSGPQRSPSKRPSRGGTRRLTSPGHSSASPANSRRSSHNRKGTIDRDPHGLRKGSYSSRGGTVRAVGNKQ